MAEAVNLTPDDYASWKGDLMNHRAKARDMSEFFLDAMTSAFLEGKVGYREGLAIRTVGQPGVAMHTDTSPPNQPGK